jgi:hypothetical protein
MAGLRIGVGITRWVRQINEKAKLRTGRAPISGKDQFEDIFFVIDDQNFFLCHF